VRKERDFHSQTLQAEKAERLLLYLLGRGFSEGVFVDIKEFFPEGMEVPAAKIVQHLLRNPYDLIDIFRLMRRFRASGADAQRALGVFEQLNPGTEELPSGSQVVEG
jgi:hypothetical protein